MKKLLYTSMGIMLSLCLCFYAKANTENTIVQNLNNLQSKTNTVCFNDGYYNWVITYTDMGNGSYTATGKVTVDGIDWSVWGLGSFDHRMGAVEFHAANPYADGCVSGYTDSFTYWGNAQIKGKAPNNTFSGSGNWTSYCSGSVYANGIWSAQGPCSNSLKSLPYGPAKHGRMSPPEIVKNTTNTICFTDNFYKWVITYTDMGNGSYTATGKVTVDGIDWSVWGLGSFEHRQGTVELHAANPHPDGCVTYTDSFTYWGNAEITGKVPNLSYTGSGNWTSYCYGDVLFTGTWSAQGPCSNASLKSLPYGPAKHGSIFSMMVSPNPLNSASTLTYNLVKESRVNITVYNFMQQPVKQVVNKTEAAGKHSYVIDGSSLNAGVYRIVAVVDGKTYTSTLQVIK